MRVALLTFMLFGACGLTACRAPNEVPPPEIPHGYSWRYEEIDNSTGTVLRTIEERAEHVEYGPIDVWRSQTAGEYALENSAEMGEEWNPDGVAESFRFPLAPGNQWKREAKYRPQDTRGPTELRGTVKAVDWEFVHVPAGWFRALRLEGEYEWSAYGGALRGTESVVRWYAPAAKREVKIIRRVRDAASQVPFRDETLRLIDHGSLGGSLAKSAAVQLAPPYAGLVAFGVLGCMLTFRFAHALGPQRHLPYPKTLWLKACATGLAAVLFVPVIAMLVAERLTDALDIAQRSRLSLLMALNGALFLLWLTGFAYRRGLASWLRCLGVASSVAAVLAIAIFATLRSTGALD